MKNRFYIFNVEKNELLYGLGKFLKLFSDGKTTCSDADRDDMAKLIKQLICFGIQHGFYGNLWHSLITYFLLMDENSYTLSIERSLDMNYCGAYSLVLHDIEAIRSIYDANLNTLARILDIDISCLIDFKKNNIGSVFNETIRDIIMYMKNKLSDTKDSEEFLNVLNDFYHKFGVGNLGLHKAFRINEDGSLVPINKIANVHFDDLIGLETQKEELKFNTNAFVNGKPSNNCLLYGDAGTGKSSSIKAIANEYFDKGLRIIEIYKHELKSLNNVISKIKDRNYKFILYMDDLSFEEFETEYKYLKAIIEGGLEKKPDNVLIYATSNRRHLVRESFNDRNDDIHKSDTMQEKLSLFGRFGVTIFFGAPDKKEYQNIVLGLKEKYNVNLSDEEVLQKANAWELNHGGRSGRSAEQLLDYIRGM